MNMRTKILSAYLPLSLLPLLAVGVLTHQRGRDLSDELQAMQLDATAEKVARHVAGRHADLQMKLVRAAWAEPGDVGVPPFHRIDVVGTGGEVWRIRDEPRESAGGGTCAATASDIRIEASIVGGPGGEGRFHIVGMVGLEHIVPLAFRDGILADGMSAMIVDRASRGLLFDPHCPGASPSRALLVSGEGKLFDAAALPAVTGRFDFEEGDTSWDAAYVNLPKPQWTVIARARTDTNPGVWPGAAMGLALLMFAIAGALIFHVLTGRLLRSLESVIRAAGRIGEGDFSPWLPPPGSDEAGRLADALGSMASRLKRMGRETERNRQLAVVGEMSSHLAHEIRNPLSSISLHLQSVSREVRRGSTPADLPEVLNDCLGEIGRLERVVEGVLRLGRAGSARVRQCRMRELVVAELRVMASELEARRIEVLTQYQTRADQVWCDPEQMRGLVLNLLRNACEAMPDGGTIRIWTTAAVPDRGPALVRLHVADEGPGIPPEFRERVFEPFFTTKPNGSGIGLASGAETAAAAGGRLFVEKRSELERGAEIILELPQASDGGLIPGDPPQDLEHRPECAA